MQSSSEQKSLLAASVSIRYGAKPPVIRSAEFRVDSGEIVGLVGHSGSGKSTLALSLLGLSSLKGARAEGSIEFRGRNLLKLTDREMRKLRGSDIAFVQQSPLSALNPVLKIGRQLREAWSAHASGTSDDREAAIRRALRTVSLPDDNEFLGRKPSQLSVGQGQRVLIAMATLHKPSLLIADEPTSALDMITQAEILQLFASLSSSYGMGVLYISHDLLSVASICHRIAILHDGEIVEQGRTKEVFADPQHPFTQALLRSIPKIALSEFELSR